MYMYSIFNRYIEESAIGRSGWSEEPDAAKPSVDNPDVVSTAAAVAEVTRKFHVWLLYNQSEKKLILSSPITWFHPDSYDGFVSHA